MNIFKRAMINILRGKKKSYILLLLLIILGTFLSGAVSIKNAIHKTETNLRAQIPPVTTLEFNHEKAKHSDGISRDITNTKPPTIEMINLVGNLPYVKAYDYTIDIGLSSRDLECAKVTIDQDLIPDSLTIADVETAQSCFRDYGAYVEYFDINCSSIFNGSAIYFINSSFLFVTFRKYFI